jgi:hypothetical protein
MIRHVHRRKTAIAISLALAFLLMAFLGRTWGVSYYRRWEASKLLAAVRQFHPGTTTEAEVRTTVKPFAGFELKAEGRPNAGSVNEVEYAFEKSPPLPWTLFYVRIDFLNGLVAEIYLSEMQVDHRGYPHPNSASVTIYSNRLRQLPDDFVGYSERFQSTGGVDQAGHWTGFECCSARSIQLDERATPVQLSRSLNFQLHCMTSLLRCKDDRQILP